ncbi:MAG: hypothetical protein ACPGU1_13175 [Myxococcota bacterium]
MSWSTLNVCVGIAAMALACQPSQERQLEEDNVMSQNLKPNPKPSTAPTPAVRDTKPRSSIRFPEALEGTGTLPLVTDEESLDDADEVVARLRGKYVQVDVRRRPVAPRQLRGHVSIVLSDGTSVSLFPIWHADARRPEEEIAAFEGLQVQVVGTAYYEAPSDPAGGASPMSPCVMDIKAMTATP